jgi:hypothetical protein
MIPGNSVAETILRIRQDSEAYSVQIEKNNELIEQLGPLAVWLEETEEDS